ncbi:MAG: DNA cytosine methyltransferase [bacterium]|nr:DNA cytosine methyltransferase [bacterium]
MQTTIPSEPRPTSSRSLGPAAPGQFAAADLFCGAGGTSQGLARAMRRLGRPLEDLDLVAVNHWKTAVRTHRLNHPWARHRCARVDALDPLALFPARKLRMIVAGVECTHHSQARGGRPVCDQSRASAWNVVHWAELLRTEHILIENVPAWRSWGPLDENNRPIKARRGEMFEAFVRALEALNYRVEWELLTCADYGDPTTRRRLFLQARLDRGDIAWPEPTHSKDGGDLPPWKTARGIIDWADLGTSIFARKRPLRPRTLERIAAGIRRFCGDLAEPFLWMLEHGSGQDSVASSNLSQRFDSLESFILPHDQFVSRNGDRLLDSIDRPLRTVTAKNGRCNYLVSPTAVAAGSQSFLVPHFGERVGQAPRVHCLDRPDPTVTATKGAGSLCTPFLVRYNRTGAPQSLENPLGTVTTRDRFALVTPQGAYELDILFRMLKPRELARAQGFEDDYRFVGSEKDAVRQIGNAVPVHTAEELCYSALAA